MKRQMPSKNRKVYCVKPLLSMPYESRSFSLFIVMLVLMELVHVCLKEMMMGNYVQLALLVKNTLLFNKTDLPLNVKLTQLCGQSRNLIPKCLEPKLKL